MSSRSPNAAPKSRKAIRRPNAKSSACSAIRTVARLIRRCNDFGAGGVSVAIGELADGLRIDLDRVPRKYEGLDGTELAISESQERMAVVVAPGDAAAFIAAADRENLEAVRVAEVTAEPRLVMLWRGRPIVDLARSFIDTNGAPQDTTITVHAARSRRQTGSRSPASRLWPTPCRRADFAGLAAAADWPAWPPAAAKAWLSGSTARSAPARS